MRVDDAFCLARAQMLMLLQLARMALALVMLQLVMLMLVDMIQRRLARMTRRGGG